MSLGTENQTSLDISPESQVLNKYYLSSLSLKSIGEKRCFSSAHLISNETRGRKKTIGDTNFTSARSQQLSGLGPISAADFFIDCKLYLLSSRAHFWIAILCEVVPSLINVAIRDCTFARRLCYLVNRKFTPVLLYMHKNHSARSK